MFFLSEDALTYSPWFPLLLGCLCRIMEGFQWALKGESSCINLFFESWTLNTPGKFVLGMLGVVLLGICTEGISRLRHGVLEKARGCHAEEHLKYSLLQTGLHAVHAFSGYILMLATMTYSCEMMLSVIVGLMIGYFAFGRVTVVSANPCCAFLEEESGPPQTLLEPLNEACSEENCCHGVLNSMPTQGNHRSQEGSGL
jgi:hypothetical protein